MEHEPIKRIVRPPSKIGLTYISPRERRRLWVQVLLRGTIVTILYFIYRYENELLAIGLCLPGSVWQHWYSGIQESEQIRLESDKALHPLDYLVSLLFGIFSLPLFLAGWMYWYLAMILVVFPVIAFWQVITWLLDAIRFIAARMTNWFRDEELKFAPQEYSSPSSILSWLTDLSAFRSTTAIESYGIAGKCFLCRCGKLDESILYTGGTRVHKDCLRRLIDSVHELKECYENLQGIHERMTRSIATRETIRFKVSSSLWQPTTSSEDIRAKFDSVERDFTTAKLVLSMIAQRQETVLEDLQKEYQDDPEINAWSKESRDLGIYVRKEMLMQAIQNHQAVVFDYKGKKDSFYRRRAATPFMFSIRLKNCVDCQTGEDNAYKTFSITRMRNLQIAAQSGY